MANQVLRFDVTKDAASQVSQEVITGRVGDGGLKLVTLNLVANQQSYNLTGINIVFYGVKPDGKKIVDDSGSLILDPQNGIARYIFPKQAFTVQGQYQQAFFKFMRGTLVDSTVEFKINVLQNQVEFGINSDNYLSEYEQLIADLRKKEADFLDEMKETAEQLAEKIGEIDTKQQYLEEQIKALDAVKRTEYDEKMKVIDSKLSRSIYKDQGVMNNG